MDNDELFDEDELVSSQYIPTDDILNDKEILTIDEVEEMIIDVVEKLSYIDKYKNQVSNKRREVDYRILDILHPMENDENDEENLTSKGCRNVLSKLSKLRKYRRMLKVSDELIYEFQKRNNRLNNDVNRNGIIFDIKKAKNKLTCPYKYRITTEDEINKLFEKKVNNKQNNEDITIDNIEVEMGVGNNE